MTDDDSSAVEVGDADGSPGSRGDSETRDDVDSPGDGTASDANAPTEPAEWGDGDEWGESDAPADGDAPPEVDEDLRDVVEYDLGDLAEAEEAEDYPAMDDPVDPQSIDVENAAFVVLGVLAMAGLILHLLQGVF